MSIRRPGTLRVVVLAAALSAAACKGDSCTVATQVFTTSVNGTGFGPTEGVPIAKFDLTQDFVSHTPYAACTTGPLQDVGVVRVTVTGTYTTPVAVKYELQGLNAAKTPVWSYIDSIPRLAPGDKITRTDIATSATTLDGGARVIFTAINPVP